MTRKYQGLPGVFSVRRHVDFDTMNVEDTLTVVDSYDRTLAVQVQTTHSIRIGVEPPSVTSEAWGEINLAHDEMVALRDRLNEVIAHRAAHEAGLPTYSARFLSEAATGDHRIGIFERFTDHLARPALAGPPDREKCNVVRSLTTAGYRVVGPTLGDHLVDLGYIADVKEIEP